jgi:hypothetical protein
MNFRILTRKDWVQFVSIILLVLAFGFSSFALGALMQYKHRLVQKHLHHASY